MKYNLISNNLPNVLESIYQICLLVMYWWMILAYAYQHRLITLDINPIVIKLVIFKLSLQYLVINLDLN